MDFLVIGAKKRKICKRLSNRKIIERRERGELHNVLSLFYFITSSYVSLFPVRTRLNDR